MTGFQLAQANWARALAPLEDPRMAGFVERLQPVNALADGSLGFVWRLQTDEGDSTSIRAFEDERIVFNMSVWETVDALREYVYASAHLEVVRRRGEWFETPDRAPFVLWWTPAGTLPDVSEGVERLERLWRDGAGPEAFTFRALFAPPGSPTRTPPRPRT